MGEIKTHEDNKFILQSGKLDNIVELSADNLTIISNNIRDCGKLLLVNTSATIRNILAINIYHNRFYKQQKIVFVPSGIIDNSASYHENYILSIGTGSESILANVNIKPVKYVLINEEDNAIEIVRNVLYSHNDISSYERVYVYINILDEALYFEKEKSIVEEFIGITIVSQLYSNDYDYTKHIHLKNILRKEYTLKHVIENYLDIFDSSKQIYIEAKAHSLSDGTMSNIDIIELLLQSNITASNIKLENEHILIQYGYYLADVYYKFDIRRHHIVEFIKNIETGPKIFQYTKSIKSLAVITKATTEVYYTNLVTGENFSNILTKDDISYCDSETINNLLKENKIDDLRLLFMYNGAPCTLSNVEVYLDIDLHQTKLKMKTPIQTKISVGANTDLVFLYKYFGVNQLRKALQSYSNMTIEHSLEYSMKVLCRRLKVEVDLLEPEDTSLWQIRNNNYVNKVLALLEIVPYTFLKDKNIINEKLGFTSDKIKIELNDIEVI